MNYIVKRVDNFLSDSKDSIETNMSDSDWKQAKCKDTSGHLEITDDAINRNNQLILENLDLVNIVPVIKEVCCQDFCGDTQ